MEKLILKDILPCIPNSLLSSDDMTPFGDAEIMSDGGIFVKDVGGIRSKKFTANQEVFTHFAIKSETSLTLKVGYTDSEGCEHLDGIFPSPFIDRGGLKKIWKSFDAAGLAVYKDAKDFFLIIEGTGNFELIQCTVRERNHLEQLSIYANDLEGIIRNIDKRLSAIEYKAVSRDDNILTSPSGKKFMAKVDDDGVISCIPLVPNKVLFMGNSILLGMCGSYGMCATSPEKDYFHYVSKTISEKNPKAEFFRVHGSQFEHLESAEDFDELWNTTPNNYTKRPLCESFTPDLDLIIIQLLENVNTEEKLRAFTKNVEKFLTNVKKASPKARILWFNSWWRNVKRSAILESACKRHGVKCISISDLYSKDTIGHPGQMYLSTDGTLLEAKDGWLTNPGDEGMKAIADRMIDALEI